MKTPLNPTLAALSFAMLAALVFTGCQSTGSGSRSGSHQMSDHNSSMPMSGQTMSDR